jgi:WD40 repeat protein
VGGREGEWEREPFWYTVCMYVLWLCRCLAIGCSEHLCIWETRTGNLLQKFTSLNNAAILSLCYSPSGSQVAAGLYSGEIQVFDILSSSPAFLLPPTNVRFSPFMHTHKEWAVRYQIMAARDTHTKKKHLLTFEL